jgi:hypothetical protein
MIQQESNSPNAASATSASGSAVTLNVGNVTVSIGGDHGNMITSSTGSCAMAQQRRVSSVGPQADNTPPRAGWVSVDQDSNSYSVFSGSERSLDFAPQREEQYHHHHAPYHESNSAMAAMYECL